MKQEAKMCIWVLPMLGALFVLLGIFAYTHDPYLGRPLLGVLGGIGTGLLLSIPYSGQRFAWFGPKSKVRQPWLNLFDLAWRIALIVAIELALRELDWRYFFKAQAALLALVIACQLWPKVPDDYRADDLRISCIRTCLIGLGVAILTFAGVTSGIFWLLPLALLSLGAGLIYTTIAYSRDEWLIVPPALIIVTIALAFPFGWAAIWGFFIQLAAIGFTTAVNQNETDRQEFEDLGFEDGSL